MLTIFPSTVCTSVAHPTEQYGQTLGVALACLIRSSCARARVGARLTPSPAMPPSAVPVKAPADRLKKSRRDRSMSPPGVEMNTRPSLSTPPLEGLERRSRPIHKAEMELSARIRKEVRGDPGAGRWPQRGEGA